MFFDDHDDDVLGYLTYEEVLDYVQRVHDKQIVVQK